MKTNDHKDILKRFGYASLIVTIIFIISVIVNTAVNSGTLDIYLNDGMNVSDYAPENGMVEISAAPDNARHMIVTAKKGRKGKEMINNVSSKNFGSLEYVNVMNGGFIFNMSNGNFSGCRTFAQLVQSYLLIITILIIASFIVRCRYQIFSYSTLLFGGTALFMTGLSIATLFSVISLIRRPEEFNMFEIYSIIKSAGGFFATITMPFMVIFAIALAVSNRELLKREGRGFSNMLAYIMSGTIIIGYVLLFFIDNLFTSGSEFEMRLFSTAESVYTTAFAYLETMLIGSMICGRLAARRKPATDKTHIIILGCAIADDGTPLPLLQGRIDRAVALAKDIRKKTGRSVKFVPSGGQGSDEIISEAESMKNYLISRGISENDILTENRSTNTRENMRFSLDIIKADCEEPNIVFSTSDYHVLRSGIISANEGLDAEGIGCKTKWYFWPNAFIREFIGLLVSKLKQHIFWLVYFIVVFAAVNMFIPL